MAKVEFERQVVSDGRITIPDDIRQALEIKDGDHVRFKGTLEVINHVQGGT